MMSAVCLPSVPCDKRKRQEDVKPCETKVHPDTVFRLLATGASRQLDVWDFESSAANGCQQRHSWQRHSHSSQSQLSQETQRVQGGHSPTLQSPASHAEYNFVKKWFTDVVSIAIVKDSIDAF